MIITEDERYACMFLCHLKTTGLKSVKRLIHHYGSAVNAVNNILQNEKETRLLNENGIIKATTLEELKNEDYNRWYENINQKMLNYNIKASVIIDEDFPERLKEIPDCPLVLYYRGNLELTRTRNTIGSIGSRRPTSYGLMMAEEFCKELASRGITIVSGMAYGIDARSHRSAISSGGSTIAVLGGGVDICYPRTNFDIYTEMCSSQLVLSEYEPGREHLSMNFPQRNRIISGLSDTLLVVEAAQKSGTLITVDFGLEQGKTIYAIPGRATDLMSRGVNNLIKQGAMLVDSPMDIIMDMLGTHIVQDGVARDSNKSNKTRIKSLPANKQKILGMLGYEPVYIDELIRANDMKISETIHLLRELEDEGFIVCFEKSYYLLKV